MDKKFVYISGPISGDRAHYKEHFATAERELREAGYIPVNPAVMPEELEGGKAMRVALAMLEVSDEVALLPGWEHSGGAQIEKRYAEYAGKPVWEWKPRVKEVDSVLPQSATPTAPPSSGTSASLPASEREPKRKEIPISPVKESDVPVRYMKPKKLVRANTEKNRSRVERMFGPKADWNTPAVDSEQVQEARGFLIIECEHCGERTGCNLKLKKPAKGFRCAHCGKVMDLSNVKLRLANVNCPNCGRKATYRTNITAEKFPFACYGCGQRLLIRKSVWNDVYVTERKILPETEKIPTGGGEISGGA